jgi:hypothetical protein
LRPGLKIFLPIIAVIFICIGWSIFWRIAADATESGINDWFAQERAAGRVWTCADRTVSGFPFRIEVRCLKPTFAGPATGVRVDGSVGDIVAVAHVYQPTLIVADVAPPLHVQSNPDRGSADMSWRSFRVSYRSGDGTLLLGSLSVSKPGLTVRPPAGEIQATARTLEFHVRPTGGTSNAFDVALSATGLAAPIIDQALGAFEPMDISAGATIQRMDAFTHASNALPLEKWRRAGGTAHVTELKLTKGDVELTSTGKLDLDDTHRVRGRMTLLAKGLSPILEKFGVPTAALAIGSLLGGSDGPAPPPGMTKLSIGLEGGRVSIGPIRLPIALNPLY